MLRNQLALTEGLKDNQKAITRGFEQFERLADMKELPQIEDFDDDESASKKSEYETIKLNIENNYDESDFIILRYGFPRPRDFFLYSI